jgi:hypothetical protein
MAIAKLPKGRNLWNFKQKICKNEINFFSLPSDNTPPQPPDNQPTHFQFSKNYISFSQTRSRFSHIYIHLQHIYNA